MLLYALTLLLMWLPFWTYFHLHCLFGVGLCMLLHGRPGCLSWLSFLPMCLVLGFHCLGLVGATCSRMGPVHFSPLLPFAMLLGRSSLPRLSMLRGFQVVLK